VSEDLYDAAVAAMAFSHSPYSNFPVGAAIRADDGRVYAGANIENAAYPEGLCAEATAIANMVMGGGRKICEIAVIAQRMPNCPPCGGCRQKIAEFATGATRIYLCDDAGIQAALTMDELLPGAFDKSALG